MAKLNLVDIASLQNETTAIQTINANNAKIEAALEKTLTRDGTTPNQLEAALDVNSQRVMNLPPPQAGTDAARLLDVVGAALPDIAIPTLVANFVLSNDGTVLSWRTPSSLPGLGDLKSFNNLSDVSNVATARTNLGLGTAALANIGTAGNVVVKANGVNSWSGLQVFSAGIYTSGEVNFAGLQDVILSATPVALSPLSVGYRGAPQNTQNSNYTLSLNDAGKTVIHTAAGAHTWTIPLESAVNFPVGTTIVLHNTGAGAVTIARTSGVDMRLAGNGTSADRSLAQHGLATLYKSSANSWYISGAGLT